VLPTEEEGEEEVAATEAETESLFVATISNIFSLGTGNDIVAIFVGLMLIIALGYLLYYLHRKHSEE